MPPAFSDREAAALALRCLDLTSLREDDTAERIVALAERARTPHGAPAALCVYPAWLQTARAALDARGLRAVRLATVVNFPRGESPVGTVCDEVAAARAAGADEIDVVLPWRALQAGDEAGPAALLAAVRTACGPQPLKVILETGELETPDAIARASRVALAAGADFLKTSTGKTARHATPEAAAVMLAEIDQARSAGGRPCGLKVSGGVAGLAEVQTYLALAARHLGRASLGPGNFRFGASSLLPALLAVLDGGAATPAAPGGY
ncbi:deoxyribose-phosphate aldolase [Piscinibacter sakaiensis]|uniref:deoxyribose-phosphate aldolase n=1 Tax=Piscinibacter sakaiensis TaxID=1547922 RepID=UPI0006B487FE|nr:deoxyribose-phosphate aldolase [Piscinibacter sakaiensis]